MERTTHKELFGIVKRSRDRGSDGSQRDSRGQARDGRHGEDEADRGFWTRIGTAFENRDGSFNLCFDYCPTDAQTTIQMRDPRPLDSEQGDRR